MLNRSEFCHLVANARAHKLAGTMSGGSFRYHPCFVLRGRLLFVNEWNVNEYCGIYVLPPGVEMTSPAVDIDPSYGCPWPEFNGQRTRGDALVCVWSGDKMAPGPWEGPIAAMIADLQREIADATAVAKAKAEADAAERRANHDARMVAAAAAFGGQ